LKGRKFFYFKTRNDLEATGLIELEADSFVKDEKDKDKKRRYMFSVGTSQRVYFIHADTEGDMRQWMDAIKRCIDGNPPDTKTPTTGSVSSHQPLTQISSAQINSQPSSTPAASSAVTTNGISSGGFASNNSSSPRARLIAAKNVIPYLQEDQSKVLEFWQIWTESVPAASDIQHGTAIEFHVATSADMQKLTWRTAGPQNIFIQKMVDFFWNVGAPESEIDRLNDVGALINPVRIGSWIDMSAKGGMDGGWYFPVEIPLKLAIEASDAGDPTRKVTEWGEANSVTTCYSVGRDMGAAPPRQTEIRLRLPGNDFTAQLRLAMDAFFVFGFPAIPEDALAILRTAADAPPAGPLCLSIITSSEGFVRLGVLVPKPSADIVTSLCQVSQADPKDILRLQSSLGQQGPAYAEYQYLMRGFGYGVYKEGFDIVFHYAVGEDVGE